MIDYGEKVRLRPIEREDLPRFVTWFSDQEVRRHLLVYTGFSLAHEERWFQELLGRMERQETLILVIETKSGTPIGNIGLHDIDWKNRQAELGIVIGEKTHWGQGYGPAAIRTMLRLAFQEMNLHRVFLVVNADNQRGIRCYQKVGFQHEGTLRDATFKEGTYCDQYVMSVLATEYAPTGTTET